MASKKTAKKKSRKVSKPSKKKTTKKIAKKKPLTQQRKLTIEESVSLEFAQAVSEKFDRVVNSIILFGSQARGTNSANSDIDIVIIVDDASINWDMELIAWYREELGKIITKKAGKYERDFHINTIKLTTWWNDLMHGDPVVLNIIRYGQPLIDSGGMYRALKTLLIQGKIHSTPEAAFAALQRVPEHLVRSRYSELNAIEGVYWGMIDAAQAALITAGKVPPSPEHVPAMIKENFVDSGMLGTGYVQALKDLHSLHKGIDHNEITSITGVEVDKWQDVAERFLREMTRIIDNLLEYKKK